MLMSTYVLSLLHIPGNIYVNEAYYLSLTNAQFSKEQKGTLNSH